MAKIVEIKPGYLVNVDNVRFIKANPAKNGGTPMVMISYIDCVGCGVQFESKEELNGAMNILKNL
jgi:hypothetical protein